MQIIAELEKTPRRIYTGAIGFIGPGRQAQFNVAIRTVLIDKRTRQAEYGVGGGIVWDSVAEQELEECRTKAKILANPRPEFELLETMLWTPGEGFSLLDEHLCRLVESADYFSMPLELDAARPRLADLTNSLPSVPHRVRMLVNQRGEISLEAHQLVPLPQPYRVALAKAPLNSQDVFLYHKTTHRKVYEQALAGRPGWDEVLLWNERRELTESTIGNLVVEKDGRLLTPPVKCGVLPGVYRGALLQQKRVQEEIIPLEDLVRCSRVYLANSVRGLWEVSREAFA
jgi:para-aminobenzoate synthetase/4-amino-4-deoxychorismate lyase